MAKRSTVRLAIGSKNIDHPAKRTRCQEVKLEGQKAVAEHHGICRDPATLFANAYGAYIGKTVELTWSFLEKLAAVRSLDKAFDVQKEFAKQAFETFHAESRKIQELHSELARQRVVHLEGFVARITQTTFALRATYP